MHLRVLVLLLTIGMARLFQAQAWQGQALREFAEAIEAAAPIAEAPADYAFVAATTFNLLGDAEAALRVNELIPQKDARHAFAYSSCGQIERAIEIGEAATEDVDLFDPRESVLLDDALYTATYLGKIDEARDLVVRLEEASADDEFVSTYGYRRVLAMPINEATLTDGDHVEKAAIAGGATTLLLYYGERQIADEHALVALNQARWLEEEPELRAAVLESVVIYYALVEDKAALMKMWPIFEEAGGVSAVQHLLAQGRVALSSGDLEEARHLRDEAMKHSDELPNDFGDRVDWLGHFIGYMEAVDPERVKRATESPLDYTPDYLMGMMASLSHARRVAEPLPSRVVLGEAALDGEQ